MKNIKGIVLAGGRATRLGDLTKVISKQMLPVYKQPMIFYPLKTLKDMGITDVLIIVSSDLQRQLYTHQLGDGSDYGLNLTYKIQDKPNGLAEAFILGEEFIDDSDVCLILGDNVFILNDKLEYRKNTIFTYQVKNPSAYGVADLDESGNLKSIVEKPTEYISDNAVVGLYMFDSSVVDAAKNVKPSKRGELEIVDVIKTMNEKSPVNVQNISGIWFDCGTPDDLLECAEYVKALTKRTNRCIMLK